MIRRPFLTGSRCYGAPRPDSDYDIVVHVTDQMLDTLIECAQIELHYGETASLKFGNLNLIATSDESVYDAWYGTTERLARRKRATGVPVDRDEAVKAFRLALSCPESSDPTKSVHIECDPVERMMEL